MNTLNRNIVTELRDFKISPFHILHFCVSDDKKKTLKSHITVCSGDTIHEIFIESNLNLPTLDVFCDN